MWNGVSQKDHDHLMALYEKKDPRLIALLQEDPVAPVVSRYAERFYQSQKDACDAMIQYIKSGLQHILLHAPTQGGKTMVYRLFGCECIRLGLCVDFYIISGVPYLDLRKQVKAPEDIKMFLQMYLNYLVEDKGLSEVDALAFIQDSSIQSKLEKNVYFGSCELKKMPPFANHGKPTLIIQDELHYAQGPKNSIADFYSKIVVGFSEKMKTKGENVLYAGVSATGYTLMSNLALKDVDNDSFVPGSINGVVNMKPGPGYFGIDMMDIQYFDAMDVKEVLQRELGARDELKYVLVRTKPKESEKIELEEIARSEGYAIAYFDQGSKKDLVFTMKNFEKPPLVKTVVFVKNFLRLGMNLLKQHLSFVMETSRHPKTDTAVQAFIGRLCGYDNPGNIPCFISNKLEPDIDLHIKMSKGQGIDATSMPSNVNGLKRKRVHKDMEFIPNNVIPISVPYEEEYSGTNKSAKEYCLVNAFNSGACKNHNPIKQSEEIARIVNGRPFNLTKEGYHKDGFVVDDDAGQGAATSVTFRFFDLEKRTATKEDYYNRLYKHFKDKKVMRPGSTFGFHNKVTGEPDLYQVNVFVHDKERKVFFIVQTREDSKMQVRAKIPCTDKKKTIFFYRSTLEDPEIQVC